MREIQKNETQREHRCGLGKRFIFILLLLQPLAYGSASQNDVESPSQLSESLETSGETALTLEAKRQVLPTSELETKVIQLSYIDIEGAIVALKGLGVRVVDTNSPIPDQVDFANLPLVVKLPAPARENMGLVGKGGIVQTGQMGSTVMPMSASELTGDVVASPAARLAVMFDRTHPEQFGRIRSLLEDIIDRPDRQIYVEGMVIEITEAGLRQLGVEWDLQDGEFAITAGSLSTNLREDVENLSSTLFAQGDSTQNLSSEWMVKIRALLVDGKAKVLSRPSILALNNRQATIRIGEDIPIATSQEGIQGDTSKISFDFKYIPVGILLNIRPRVSQDSSEISLMVDTIVSSAKPGQDLEIRDEDGRLLASAPYIATRRVQTYARIQNNTPFILGGLVTRGETILHEKVPILGDLPLLGALFRSESTHETRSEVIIVLTPYVLPEKIHLSRALPKGNEYLDDDESILHRSTFRIAIEDIHEVRFLYHNARFERYRELALKALRRDFRLAEQDPYYWFAEGRCPGERILVNQFIYNFATRLKLGEKVNTEKIFLLVDHDPLSGGYQTNRLEYVLANLGNGSSSNSFFEQNTDEALAIIFYDLYEATDHSSLISDPVPELKKVRCHDRRSWTRLLWELNQPAENGRTRHTILIHQPEDIMRLQRSIMVKYILELNGGGGPEASLLKFIPGRMIEVPDIKPAQLHMINAPVARHFFHSSEHFYAATLDKIESSLKQLDTELNPDDAPDVKFSQPKAVH